MKIVEWLKTHIINVKKDNAQLFGDIKLSVFNGYVHLARKGIKVDDVITEKEIPGLTYFRWQYGVPIDYDTLKYILFQSEFQEKIQRDLKLKKFHVECDLEGTGLIMFGQRDSDYKLT